LSLTEQGHQYVAAIRKFDRIMMPVGDVSVDLAELADPKVSPPRPDPSAVVFDVFSEGEFGPR
jgi:hypothetical protein